MLDNYSYCREKMTELTQEVLHPPRLLFGDDLIAMGLSPGPVFKEILRTVEDAQLNNEISTKEDAQKLVVAHILRLKK